MAVNVIDSDTTSFSFTERATRPFFINNICLADVVHGRVVPDELA